MKLNGTGKYDDVCTAARVATNAQACLLLVLNGERGSGTSLQFASPHLVPFLADVLEATLKQMRMDMAERGTP